MLRLILKENFFHFNERTIPTKPWNCNGHKDSSFDSFANIFMTYIETTTLSKTVFRTTVWKCYIHDIFSLHWTSKLPSPNYREFKAEAFDTETAFLDTDAYKGTRFKEKSIRDANTHFKQTETFLHTHFTTCHLPNVKKGFVKGEALRILRKNSSETNFEENNSNLKKKNAWWTEATHSLSYKTYYQNKIHKRESELLKQNNKEEKKYCHSWHNTSPRCLL